jgi:type II secretory pathway pseudopilin PulG
MSKSNKSLLAELLEQKSNVAALINENAKNVMEATVQREVATSLQEIQNGLHEEDEDMEDDTEGDFEEVDIDLDDNTGEEDADAEESDADAEPEESDATDVMPDGMEDNEPEFGDDDEVVDLTDASLEDVINAIQNAQDGDSVRIVKVPTYDVSIESDQAKPEMGEPEMGEPEMGEPEMGEPEMGEPEMGEPEMGEPEMGDDDDLEESKKMDEEDCMTEDCTDKEVYENKKPKAGKKLNEQKVKAFIVAKNKQLAIAENKIKALQKQLAEQKQKLDEATDLNSQYSEVLVEAKNTINELALTNTKMAHISQLYTNYTTTSSEKKQIAESFDNDVTTINESKLAYKMWANKLEDGTTGKVSIPLENKINISENKEKTNKKIIKEEKTYQQSNDPFDRFAFFGEE